jgi:hypothetical protein
MKWEAGEKFSFQPVPNACSFSDEKRAVRACMKTDTRISRFWGIWYVHQLVVGKIERCIGDRYTALTAVAELNSASSYSAAAGFS